MVQGLGHREYLDGQFQRLSVDRWREIRALCAMQGDRLVIVLGGTTNPVEIVQKLADWFGPGPIVVGPVVPDLMAAVTSARAQLQQAGTPGQAAEANNMLTQTLRSLFAVAEAYPNLKADQNFRELQAELTDTEDKIAYARQFYNTNVLSYNTKTQTFPSVIFANMFGFQPAEFFEAEEAAREDVHVSFTPTPPAATS